MPVYTKKDGRVYCVYYDGQQENGKPRRVWEPYGRGKTALRKAKTRDLEVMQAKADGSWIKNQHSYLFSQLAADYIFNRQKELADGTREEILSAINRYAIPLFGTKPISDITIRDWTAVHDKSIQDGANVNTINTRFRYLSKIFRWAVAQKLLKENPWRDRESLRKKKYKVELPTIKEFNKILTAAPDHLRFILKLEYHTGARPGGSELFALKEEDCDFRRRRIRIPTTKNKDIPWRWQYIDPVFMREIKTRIERRRKEGETSPYLCTYKGEPITNQVAKSWRTAKKNAGITRRIRLYDIRHLHITYALAGGANPIDLAERAGHVNTDMINRVYTHMVDEIRSKEAFLLPKLKKTVDKNSRRKKEKNKEGKNPE